jgi:hypothetical protein
MSVPARVWAVNEMVGNFNEWGSPPPATTPALIFFTSCDVKLDALDTDIVGSSRLVGNSLGPTATARELATENTRAVIASEVLNRTHLTVVDEWLPRSVGERTTVEIL